MNMIGAKALLDFSRAHPRAAADLRALAGLLATRTWSSGAALAAALGEQARADGAEVVVSMPWCGARVQLLLDAVAELIIVQSVESLPRSSAKEHR